MGFLAKLFINDRVINVLDTDAHLYRNVHPSTFQPTSGPLGGMFSVTVETTGDTGLLRLASSAGTMCEGRIRFYKHDGLSKLMDIEFFDTYIVGFHANFDGVGIGPMTDHIVFSPGIMRIGDAVLEKPWKVTDLKRREKYAAPEPVAPAPKVRSVKWKSAGGETLKETGYGKEVALEIAVANPDGGRVEVTIEKADGSEFDDGRKTLTFTEYLSDDGTVGIGSLKIKEQWEEFKQADVDGLVATVDHKGQKKKSGTLTVVPSPKVLANLRPNTQWKGEFGFDWIRNKDTSLFGDNEYEDIVSKQYTDSAHTTLETNGNKSGGFFQANAKLFDDLKKQYDKFTAPWAITDRNGDQVPEDICVPWLSLLYGKEAKLSLVLEIEAEADYLEFEDNEYFEVTPKTVDISGKTGKVELKDSLTLKCIKEHQADEVLVIKAVKKIPSTGELLKVEAGKLKAWANDAAKQKEKKVVFVQVETPEIDPIYGKRKGNATNEKNRISNYLEQAFITLDNSSTVVDLNVSTDPVFHKYINLLGVDYKNNTDNEQLHNFLKEKLKVQFSDLYKDHFKAFYFGEAGGAAGGLSGYSQSGADYVVVFNTANEQTASHEFLHSMNLAHSFANNEADGNADFTYQYKKTDNLLDYSHHIAGHKNSRCSLWFWQWVKANDSII